MSEAKASLILTNGTLNNRNLYKHLAPTARSTFGIISLSPSKPAKVSQTLFQTNCDPSSLKNRGCSIRAPLPPGLYHCPRRSIPSFGLFQNQRGGSETACGDLLHARLFWRDEFLWLPSHFSCCSLIAPIAAFHESEWREKSLHEVFDRPSYLPVRTKLGGSRFASGSGVVERNLHLHGYNL